MKRTITWLVVLVLCMGCTAGLAEGWQDSEQKNLGNPVMDGMKLNTVVDYLTTIAPVNGTDYLIMQPRGESLKGIYNLQGEAVCSELSPFLEYVNMGFYRAYADKELLNGKALVRLDAGLMSDFIYGNIVVYTANWAAGYVLSEASEAEYDLKMGNGFYWIDRCDLYYVGRDGAGSGLVGSIAGRRFVTAGAHGDYIAVQDKDGIITLYDRQFNAKQYAMAAVNTAVYGIHDYWVKNLAENEILADGYSDAREVSTTEGMWLNIAYTDWSGNKYYTLLDQNMNVVYEDPNYVITAATAQYVTIASRANKAGLYSVADRRVIVPTAYDKIITNSTTVDTFVTNGYVMVERDGLRGYVNAATGEVSCAVQYPTEDMRRIGCVMIYPAEGGFRVIAADGVETFIPGESLSCRGDGHLLVAKRDGLFGVVDWHGEEVLPFVYKSNIVITDNSQYIIRIGTGAELDQIIWE